MTAISLLGMAEKATNLMYERDPSLLERFGTKGKAKCLEDNEHHMRQLRTAHELGNSQFFTDYAIWLNGILIKHGMETRHLVENFAIIREILPLEHAECHRYRLFLDEAIEELQSINLQ